jgi:hypothetical protein
MIRRALKLVKLIIREALTPHCASNLGFEKPIQKKISVKKSCYHALSTVLYHNNFIYFIYLGCEHPMGTTTIHFSSSFQVCK